MLGKLIKHDILQGIHTVKNIYLAALIAVGFMLFGVLANSPSIKALSAMALVVIMVVIVVFTFFAVASMFNKSLYGDTGYMTLTLPVKEWQIVFSKTLTGVVFILVSYLALIAVFFGIFTYVFTRSGIPELAQVWQMLRQMGALNQDTLLVIFSFRAVLGLITILFVVSSLHLSVSLVNVSKLDKLGTFGVIVFFFGLVGILSNIANAISKLFNLYIIVMGKSISISFSENVAVQMHNQGAQTFGLTHYFVVLIASLVFCYLATLLIKKKVNVK